ncbi:unnamed protein product [Mucor hiemalis]
MFHSTGVRFANDNMNNSRGLLFPWLRRKESSWSLRSLTKMNTSHSVSVVSLPLSNTSTIEEDEVHNQEEEEEDVNKAVEKSTPTLEDNTALTPPTYDDKSHPWNFQMPAYLSHRVVLPREEEGKEDLPDYDCTVQKLGFIKVKCEYSLPGIRSTSRSWKYYYVHVYGTMIMAYSEKPTARQTKLKPIWKYSMHGSEATVASDYLKERHVVRLRIENGPQFLLNASTESSKKEWIASMETSMNISSDLDVRSMPQFITLLSRRNRAQGSRQVRITANSQDSPLL